MHITSPEAESLLEREVKVLDHGFVRLVDYMGSDHRIVAAARVSTGTGSKGPEQDKKLIEYLIKCRHTSPLEQVVLVLHMRLPIFVARQLVRHRTARINELSGRYSVLKDEFYIPDPDQVRLQSSVNKQGRSESQVLAPLDELVRFEAEQGAAAGAYHERLQSGMARELARINLPLSVYTEWYWQMDLHNLFHFLALRLDAHAQWEIRQYAQVLLQMARAVAPMATEAWERYILHSVTLSQEEVQELKQMVAKEQRQGDVWAKLAAASS